MPNAPVCLDSIVSRRSSQVTSVGSLTILIGYLSAGIASGRGSSSQMSGTPTWSPGTKIAVTYLAPCLDEYCPAATSNA